MEPGLFLELRRRRGGALLIVRAPKEESLPLDISVTPTLLQVKSPQGCKEVSLPGGVTLVPSSCRGLQYVAGDGLHVRLQILADSHSEAAPTLSQSVKAQESCTFYCQTCGEVIIRERRFHRVLPLPSENWSALVDEWCCHPDPFANRELLPQENDCFVGDTHFHLNLGDELLEPGSEVTRKETHPPASESQPGQKPKANTRVICKRCKTLLGESTTSDSHPLAHGTTKLFVTEIIIKPSGQDFAIVPRSQYVQSVFAQCLLELSSARSTFRFSIQGHDGKTYILMWLLNSDTMLVESLGNSEGSNVFTVFEDLLSPDSNSLEARDAIKVLYHPCIKNRNKELASSWETDIGVHALTLPSKTCLELLVILSWSNRVLPSSLRYMNSFQFYALLAGGTSPYISFVKVTSLESWHPFELSDVYRTVRLLLHNLGWSNVLLLDAFSIKESRFKVAFLKL
ncbi:E3 ubiquitin-protein ligase E3D isoform X1 [Ornithorhynchus anatinus]|uniref:E3 ubiquitin-protein ligase E3D isoform X1 n=1 Tax=Ornithorhynchus anatinus TaxID=9258 RepID=UPI0010A786DA|nr:E3 ubiquitin-protein ligase E3D isoform X1 [Ornithorhynchus anatinus]